MNKRTSKKGFTLVEAIASIALIGIISVLLLSAFYAQYRTIQLNAQNKAADKQSQQSVERQLSGEFEDSGDELAQRSPGTFRIDFGGLSIQSDGDYLNGHDGDGGFVYKYFEPEE